MSSFTFILLLYWVLCLIHSNCARELFYSNFECTFTLQPHIDGGSTLKPTHIGDGEAGGHNRCRRSALWLPPDAHRILLFPHSAETFE